jgi:hypothetical protein
MLKPHLDRVRQTERQMDQFKSELTQLDEQLSDENLYSDPGRVDDIRQWTHQQSELRTLIADLEWQWLEASEALENASGEIENNE